LIDQYNRIHFGRAPMAEFLAPRVAVKRSRDTPIRIRPVFHDLNIVEKIQQACCEFRFRIRRQTHACIRRVERQTGVLLAALRNVRAALQFLPAPSRRSR
jgi:hypothetical protein